ncbi:MAG: hypothetical protein KC444_07870 [Nitrosopumilus sp.]|nr:hypothetical protein [Nitrosopumilus sp.]
MKKTNDQLLGNSFTNLDDLKFILESGLEEFISDAENRQAIIANVDLLERITEKDQKEWYKVSRRLDSAIKLGKEALNHMYMKYGPPVEVKKSVVVKEELEYDPEKMEFNKPYKFTMYGQEYAIVKSKKTMGKFYFSKIKKNKKSILL